MGKPKMYGMVKPGSKMGNHMDKYWQRKLQRQRNRERATPSLVAGNTKVKEGQQHEQV